MATRTLIDLLEHAADRARTTGNGLTYVVDDTSAVDQPYDVLRREACRVLAGLRAAGVSQGDRVMVVLPVPATFYPVFWGCQLGGVVPVALAPPTGRDDIEGVRRLAAIWQKLGRPHLVCEEQYAGQVSALLSSIDTDHEPLAPLTPQGLAQDAVAEPADVADDDVAYIQFSSGSTSFPKGVRLNHRNLIANVEQMCQRFAITEADVELAWMPHHHDLGLMGCHLSPLSVAARQVKIDPLLFLRRPARWFDWASRSRATILTATPSALRSVLRQVTTTGDWDLSTVKEIIIGAEPIPPSVLDRLGALLAPCGLRPGALVPSYGLAEGTLGITACSFKEHWKTHRLDRSSLTGDGVARPVADGADKEVALITDLGQPLEGLDVRVVDDDDRELDERRVGHVQIRGPNVTHGYEGDDEATTAARCGDWWRTGDQGFLCEGRLAICGRTNDMIFVGGRNLHAIDLEQIAEQAPGVQRAVAVAVPQGAEREEVTVLFVVTEAEDWRDDLSALEHARQRVQRAMRTAIDELVPLRRRQIPRTTSGKIQREKLKRRHIRGVYKAAAAEAQQWLENRGPAVSAIDGQGEPVASDTTPSDLQRRPQLATRWVAPRDEIERRLAAVWSAVLQTEPIGVFDNFFDLGGTSLLATQLSARITSELGRSVDVTDVFDRPTIATLADLWSQGGSLSPEDREETQQQSRHRLTARRWRRGADDPTPNLGDDLAVVGLAGRFPGASSVEALWQNLVRGVDSISRPEDGIPRGEVDGVDLFDAAYFGLPPGEAEAMDPQQRLLLETSLWALEDAACDPDRFPGLIGVYAGAGLNSYGSTWGRPGGITNNSMDAYGAVFGNEKDYLATRVAHRLNLRGPSLTVQTACSTSLVAIHLAAQALLAGDCDLALAGGVWLLARPDRIRSLPGAGSIFSADGVCRPFDKAANGFVVGNGVAIVALRRLDDAIADGDPIRAVLKSSAINNDGANKAGFVAPSVSGQADVIRTAIRLAGIKPAAIGMVEAHGTGTPLGDPIEVQALTRAFDDAPRGGCALGSLKANVGHLDVAAGATGVIKAVLALEHERIPKSLNCEHPNPAIDWPATPFFVNTEERPWPRGAEPRYAGVSSFGMGGTNAHAILTEAPQLHTAPSPRPLQLLPISARTQTALEQVANQLAEYLEDHPEANLADVAFTLSRGRRQQANRHAVVAADATEAARNLRQAVAGASVRPASKLILMFPGQGAQRPGMAKGLYERGGTFARELDRCFEGLERGGSKELGEELRGLLLAETPSEPASETLRQTQLAQPALFCFAYALARQWLAWGVRPYAYLGHSIGEWVAACLSGVFAVDDALALVAARGRLMQSLPGGSMLAVHLPAEAAQEFVGAGVVLGAHNGPEDCVLSGPTEAVQKVTQQLKERAIAHRLLATSHAFHSPMMDPIVAPFAEQVATVERHPPEHPFMSNVSGTWITPDQAVDPEYWAQHLRATVRFADNVDTLAAATDSAWLEVGPGATLAGLVRQHPQVERADVLPSLLTGTQLGSASEATRALLVAHGKLWTRELAPLSEAFFAGEQRRATSLPHYPFERSRYWNAESPDEALDLTSARASGALLDLAWRPLALPPGLPSTKDHWLIVGQGELSERLSERLCASGASCAVIPFWTPPVPAGAESQGEIIARDSERFATAVIAAVTDAGDRDEGRCSVIVLPSVASANGSPAGSVVSDSTAVPHLASAELQRAQAIFVASSDADVSAIWLVTRNGQAAPATTDIDPIQWALWGLGRALSSEDLLRFGGMIDLDATGDADNAATQIAVEVTQPRPTREQVAWRRNRRWVARLCPGPTLPRNGIRVHRDSTYLVTGGLGGLGGLAAQWLAQQGAGHLVLATRRPDKPGADGLRRRLEQAGSDVRVAAVDLGDPTALERLFDEELRGLPPLRGIIHAAGVSGFGTLGELKLGVTSPVLAAKISGAWGLHVLTRNMPLDFFLLYSSTSSWISPIGEGDYTAANAFLDALAQIRQAAGLSATSIHWGPWAEVGMAVAPSKAGAGDHFKRHGIQWIAPQAGTALLGPIAASGLAEVGVMKVDWSLFVSRHREPLPLYSELHVGRETGVAAESQKTKPERHRRPPLPNPYVAPQTELEVQLAAIVKEVLGFDRIGVTDNFYELGGDSIAAMRVLAQARKSGIHLATDRFLTALTVREMLATADVAEGAPQAPPDAFNGVDISQDELDRLASRYGGELTGNEAEVPADQDDEAERD